MQKPPTPSMSQSKNHRAAPLRDLIYPTDKWTSYLWKRLCKDSEVVRHEVERGRTKLATFPSFAREVFSRLYAKPRALERSRPEDAWAKTLHESLDELPGWQQLSAHCHHNKDLASAAAASLLEQLVDQLPERAAHDDPEERRREVRGLLDFLKSVTDTQARSDIQQKLDAARAAGKQAVNEMGDVAGALDRDLLRQALRRTVDSAAAEVIEVSAAVAGLAGLGGSQFSSDDARSLLANELKAADSLKRLALLAGRMRRLAMARRRARVTTQPSELSDITTGDSLAHVLPHELLKLSHPLLFLDFARGFLEHSLLQYDLRSVERQGRGPLVILIDDSDSMDGAPATFARATALALADVALLDKRACRLVRFSHRINATLDLRPAGASASSAIQQTGLAEMLRFLTGPVSGGTSFELPLSLAKKTVDDEPVFADADVVLLTDGEAELSEEFLKGWARERERTGLTTWAVHIGGAAPAVLRKLTPEVIELRSLVPEKLDETLFARIGG